MRYQARLSTLRLISAGIEGLLGTMPETPPRPPNTTEVAKKAVAKVLSDAQDEVSRLVGPTSKYSPEIARSICESLSEGIPLRQICRKKGFPTYRSVYRWIAADPTLASHFARARQVGYDQIADQCLQIADTPAPIERVTETTDPKTQAVVRTVTWVDDVPARRLQVETRLKLLAKWSPERYGERTILAGDAGAPIALEDARSGKLWELVMAMESSKRARQAERK